MTSEPDDLRTEQGSAEAIFATWAGRAENGETLDFGDLLNAHPACANELNRLHEDWKLFAPLLRKLVPGLTSSTSAFIFPPLLGSDECRPPSRSIELLNSLGFHSPHAERYRFLAVLGRGGGGVVLKVWDTKFQRALAMKVVLGHSEASPTGSTPRVDSHTLSRFANEARLASQLNHPGIVPVYELGADEAGRAFFTMKLVTGEDLSYIFEHVKSDTNGWTQTRALTVILKACDAMAFAHAQGVVHRDLKPANIMVGRYGEVYVMDWGLARVMGEVEHHDLPFRSDDDAVCATPGASPNTEPSVHLSAPLITMDGTVIGTPAYMSPEQARGDVQSIGPRSDVYALGVMLYKLIGRQLPCIPLHPGLSARSFLDRLISDRPRPLNDLAPRAPPELVAICERAMARDAEDRYADTQALANDLRAYMERRVVQAHATGAWAETKKWVERNPTLAGAFATILLVVVTAAAVFARKAEQATVLAAAAEVATQAERASSKAAHFQALRARNSALEASFQAMRAQEGKREAEWNSYMANVHSSAASIDRGDSLDAFKRLMHCAPDLRGWDWRLVAARATVQLLNQLAPFSSHDAIRFIDDRHTLLAGGRNGFERCWRGADRRTMHFSVRDSSLLYTLSPSGSFSACIANDGRTIRVWSSPAARGEQRTMAPETTFPNPLPSPLSRVNISDSGDVIACCSTSGEVCILDGTTGQAIALCSVASLPTSMTISSSGDLLALGDHAGTVTVLSLLDCSTYLALNTGDSKILTLCFSDSDSHLAVATDRGQVLLLALDTLRIAERFHVKPSASALAISPDRGRIAIGLQDGSLHILSIDSGLGLARVSAHEAPITALAFCADGCTLATSGYDGIIRQWCTDSWDIYDELRVGYGGLDSLSGAPSLLTPWLSRTATSDYYSPDTVHSSGRPSVSPMTAVSQAGDSAVVCTVDQGITLWRLDESPHPDTLLFPMESAGNVSISGDGSRVFVCVGGRTVRVLDSCTGLTVAEWQDQDGFVHSVFPNRNGMRAIIRNSAGDLKIWDLAQSQAHSIWTLSDSYFATCGISMQGHLLACVDSGRPTSDRMLLLFELPSGSAHFLGEGSYTRSTPAFSADGRYLSVGIKSGGVQIWDVESKRPVQTLSGRIYDRPQMLFLPGPPLRLAVSQNERHIDIWDILRGEIVLVLELPNSHVASLGSSPNGDRLISVNAQGELRWWDTDVNRSRTSLANTRPETNQAAVNTLDVVSGLERVMRSTLPQLPSNKR